MRIGRNPPAPFVRSTGMTMRMLFRGTILLVAVGGLAACGSDSTSTATTVASTTSAAAAATTTAVADTGAPDYQIPASLPATTASATVTAAGASLALRDDPTLGPILVDAEGFTLYLFTKDTGTTSVCTGECLAAWPPAVANGTPTVGDGVDASKLTVSPQADGTRQLTYDGHLLYRYAPDQSPGDTTGQGVGGVWFALDAQGNQVGS